jgi:hypothetical protein
MALAARWESSSSENSENCLVRLNFNAAVSSGIGNRRNEVVRRRQGRVTPVGVEQRPVLQVHVGIADQRAEGQPPDELGDVRACALCAKNPGYATSAGIFVLSLGIDTEYLREVLHVNGAAVGKPIEAFDGKRRPSERAHPVGKIPDLVDADEVRRGHVHANESGERHHRELVLRKPLEFARRQLDYPRTANTPGRDGQSSPRLVQR